MPRFYTGPLSVSQILGSAPPSTTWDPTQLGTGSTLLGGNRILQYGGFTGSHSTTSKSSGKWYAEVTLHPASGQAMYPGFCQSDNDPNNINASGHQAFMDGGSDWVTIDVNGSGITAGSSTGYTAFSTVDGDIVSFMIFVDVGEIYFAYNGVWQGTQNPSTHTNPMATFTPTGGTWFIQGGGFQAPGTSTLELRSGVTYGSLAVAVGASIWNS